MCLAKTPKNNTQKCVLDIRYPIHEHAIYTYIKTDLVTVLQFFS